MLRTYLPLDRICVVDAVWRRIGPAPEGHGKRWVHLFGPNPNLTQSDHEVTDGNNPIPAFGLDRPTLVSRYDSVSGSLYLARLLKQAERRKTKRFAEDFKLLLTKEELEHWRLQWLVMTAMHSGTASWF